MSIRKKILGIIPARFGSTRFPGKPLADINGMSMIERVYFQSKKAKLLDEVIVATDDERIVNAVNAFGGKVVMTGTNHQSGTDRCLEAVNKSTGLWDIAVNIQGDEPLIYPEQIDQLAACFQKDNVFIATLIKVIKKETELNNPNVVKVVINKQHEALYFSRAAIPYNRDQKWFDDTPESGFYKHVGIYGYDVETLKKLSALPQSNLELTEALEQLRWLENGYKINIAVTDYENISVDSPEDIFQVVKYLSGNL